MSEDGQVLWKGKPLSNPGPVGPVSGKRANNNDDDDRVKRRRRSSASEDGDYAPKTRRKNREPINERDEPITAPRKYSSQETAELAAEFFGDMQFQKFDSNYKPGTYGNPNAYEKYQMLFEKFYDQPYYCPAGVYTVGYGVTGLEVDGRSYSLSELVNKGVSFESNGIKIDFGKLKGGGSFTPEEGFALLQYKIAEKVEGAREILKETKTVNGQKVEIDHFAKLNANQQAAFASFHYNMKESSIKDGIIGLIQDGRYDLVDNRMMQYVSPGTSFSEGLKNRRYGESLVWQGRVQEAGKYMASYKADNMQQEFSAGSVVPQSVLAKQESERAAMQLAMTQATQQLTDLSALRSQVSMTGAISFNLHEMNLDEVSLGKPQTPPSPVTPKRPPLPSTPETPIAQNAENQPGQPAMVIQSEFSMPKSSGLANRVSGSMTSDPVALIAAANDTSLVNSIPSQTVTLNAGTPKHEVTLPNRRTIDLVEGLSAIDKPINVNGSQRKNEDMMTVHAFLQEYRDFDLKSRDVGITGPRTRRELMAFQKENGLEITGDADLPTRDKMLEIVRNDSRTQYADNNDMNQQLAMIAKRLQENGSTIPSSNEVMQLAMNGPKPKTQQQGKD